MVTYLLVLHPIPFIRVIYRCTDLEPVIVKACHCSVGTDVSVS